MGTIYKSNRCGLKRNRIKMEKTELVITALQQRIGEIVSNYETQIAILRAEITQLVEEKKSNNDVQKTSESDNKSSN